MTKEQKEEFLQYLKNLRLIQADDFYREGLDMAISALSENKGKWIVTEVECPFCGQGLRDMKYVEEESTCPKCGADMRGKDK